MLKLHAGSPLPWLSNFVAACRPRIEEYVSVPVQPPSCCQSPWPFRNDSQSSRLPSKTSPGSTALFESTCPAPQLSRRRVAVVDGAVDGHGAETVAVVRARSGGRDPRARVRNGCGGRAVDSGGGAHVHACCGSKQERDLDGVRERRRRPRDRVVDRVHVVLDGLVDRRRRVRRVARAGGRRVDDPARLVDGQPCPGAPCRSSCRSQQRHPLPGRRCCRPWWTPCASRARRSRAGRRTPNREAARCPRCRSGRRSPCRYTCWPGNSHRPGRSRGNR
jgi:hypothetical protein